MSDPITIIENAYRDVIRGIEGVKALLGPEDLPVRDRAYPAVFVDVGNITPDYLGREEGGDPLIAMTIQIDVMTVLDAGAREFRERSRALLFRVLGALADVDALSVRDLVEELILKGVQVQDVIPAAHDFTGAIARTRVLPNNVVAIEVLGAGEAIRIRLHDRRSFDLAAATLAPLAARGDAAEAVVEAIYRETLARQQRPR